jgi:hypothetical protein
MYVIYKMFIDAIPVSGNYWHPTEFFDNKTDTPAIASLEWVQLSPPTFHTYEELPYLVTSKPKPF